MTVILSNCLHTFPLNPLLTETLHNYVSLKYIIIYINTTLIKKVEIYDLWE